MYKSTCYIEISNKSLLHELKEITFEDLKQIPCIIISSKNQRNIELEYYSNTIGIKGDFIFAENLDEARMLVAANKGYLLIESVPSQEEKLLCLLE